MVGVRALVVPLAFVTVVTGCAGPSAGIQVEARQAAAPVQSAPGRTLVMALKHNFPDLSFKIPSPGGDEVLKRVFNASLVLVDGNGVPRPYLAETLPEIGTESWQVFPGGTMETIYRLRLPAPPKPHLARRGPPHCRGLRPCVAGLPASGVRQL